MNNTSALTLAFRTSPWKKQLGHAWELVCLGAERGLFVADELQELIEYIGQGWDYGFDELLFELTGDTLRVRFLDDAADCEPALMLQALQAVKSAVGGR